MFDGQCQSHVLHAEWGGGSLWKDQLEKFYHALSLKGQQRCRVSDKLEVSLTPHFYTTANLLLTACFFSVLFTVTSTQITVWSCRVDLTLINRKLLWGEFVWWKGMNYIQILFILSESLNECCTRFIQGLDYINHTYLCVTHTSKSLINTVSCVLIFIFILWRLSHCGSKLMWEKGALWLAEACFFLDLVEMGQK